MQTSRLPSRTFTVLAAEKSPQISVENNSADNNLATTAESSGNAPAISKITYWSLPLNALLIALIVGFLYWRKNTQPRPAVEENNKLPNAKHWLNQIAKQAADNNLGAMRDSILLWGAEVFPQQLPRSLNQLADLMDNPELKQLFSQLDQSLFKADSVTDFEVESNQIIKALKQFVPVKTKNHSARKELKPLNPK